MKKSAKTKFSKPSEKDLETVAKRLHYMDPANLIKDFPDKKSRKAIAATLKWLSFNAVCAIRMKNPHNYRTAINLKKDDLMKFDSVVLERNKLDQLITLFEKEYKAL